ncbi:MAG: hypothetical protein QF381_01025 [Nitrososphaerales archaeon]|jgi:hypothetical protein|nr:hypothetical protein [Nitrososphaerales archaeon]
MEIIDICTLETLLSAVQIRNKTLNLFTTIGSEDIQLCSINLDDNELKVNEELLITEVNDKRSRLLSDSNSRMVNALMRSALLKPNLNKFRLQISQWDDVIFGLDTNIFYTCTITSSILDDLLKIPSGDFIDTPDWMTFVFSKVGMGEIENRAGHSHNPTNRRQCLRAIQEIMMINRSKDLEGISLLLTGSIPPEIDYSTSTTNTVRDSTIREQFRSFLKTIDFHKGSYFLTQDFNSAVLAEAEGLKSLYIQKPNLPEQAIDFHTSDKVNVSEVLYELAVSFQPLILKMDGLELEFFSEWSGKNLNSWENWMMGIKWRKDDIKLNEEIQKLKKQEINQKICAG